MYSLWRCVHATSDSFSSAARYVLTVWFQLKPSTGFIRCEISTNIKHVLPALLLEIDLQWCLVEGTACPHSSSYLPSKLFSCLADQRFSQPHHCFPQWLASVFLTSSLYPTTTREQQNVGGRFGQPQHCSALLLCGSRRIDRARCKRPCLVIVTIAYMQERHRLTASISTFCNFRFLQRLLSRLSSTSFVTD